jgi:predicted GNAT family acetyltransferase
MLIKQEKQDSTGRFYIEESNNTVAELVYRFTDNNNLLITHTEVDDSLAGKGIGKQLVSAAVNYAREKSYVLQATCSYAKAVLDKTKEFSDVYNPVINKADA